MTFVANWLRRLSFATPVRTSVRALGLQRPARYLYGRLFQTGATSVEREVAGARARFHVESTAELRTLDAIACEPVLPLLAGLIQPGDHILDVGAHRGVYTIFLGLASGPAGRVLAVEPDPRSLVRLRANLQLNQLEPRVQIEEVAIGAERGEVELSLCDEYMAAVNGGPGPSVRVALWRGDSLLDACQFPPPQVIKLDVEGYEDAVLAGLEQVLRQPACRLVCCEVHPHKLPPGIAAAAIGDRLERHGFTHQYKLPRAPEFHLLASRVPLPAWRS